MSTNTSHYLKTLRNRYRLVTGGEILLWSLSAAAIVFGVLALTPVEQSALFMAAMVGMLVFLIGYRLLNLHKIDEQVMVRFLNQRYPELQASADLLLKEPELLNPLEQLQRSRTAKALDDIYPSVKLPNKLGRAFFVFAGSLLVTVVLTAFVPKRNTIIHTATKKQTASSEKAAPPLPVAVQTFSITVTPPPYTGLPAATSTTPELTMPEGSRAQWTIRFSGDIQRAYLLLPSHDTIRLAATGKEYKAMQTFTESGYYQIQWKQFSGEVKTSDYYKIEIIRDRAPEVAIRDLPQSTILTINDDLNVSVAADLKDDYRIKDAYIIATVSKGSGESVKFREEKLNFASPSPIRGKQIRAARTIDLKKLGLEPGDELYFYAEAIDNRQPIANRARTETYFLSLQDTASENLTLDAGLSVDLMPDYFRSQRQIIIDTEKLLKNKKKITAHTFKSTSNELGYDQKVLRLKYGEFLGEEFETQIGPVESGVEEQAQAEAENMTRQFGHVHDKDNEHNLVPDKKQAEKPDAHEHQHEIDPNTGEEKQENPADAFRHDHDNPEEATFFNQSIRSKLKAALTEMWSAELYLRLYEPEKSLPYQYKALKLLKEVSNDSRIYVHKTGFDPPPLKEEKRLTGDLAEIKSTNAPTQALAAESYPAIRAALVRTEALLQRHVSKITQQDKAILLAAGNELAALALKQPGSYLTALSAIKALNENEVNERGVATTLLSIQKAFWKALPQGSIPIQPRRQTLHALDKAFLKNLDSSK